ncbi:MAG: hypothetical protein DSY42_00465 [Aquifex sp.]|nr:MAG: hypothetical protein DSY42_00465 [Aquifex sp.]
MDWGQVLTIIFGIAGFMSIFMFLINKRIDDLSKRIDRVEQDLRDLRKEMNERFTKLEELLLKALGVESKKEN